MSRHTALKAVAVLLCALSLTGALLLGGCVVLLQQEGLYRDTLEEHADNVQQNIAWEAAQCIVKKYYMEDLAHMPPEITQDPWLYEKFYEIQDLLRNGRIFYRIESQDGTVLKDVVPEGIDQRKENFYVSQMVLSLEYPVMTPYDPEAEDQSTQAQADSGRSDQYLYSDVWELYSGKTYHVDIYQGPYVTITVYLEETVWQERSSMSWNTCQMLYPYRYQLLAGLAGCTMLALLLLTYLGLVTGRTPGEKSIRLRGLNRLPLDLYTGLTAAELMILLPVVVQLEANLVYHTPQDMFVVGLVQTGGFAFVMVLPCIGFFCGLVAQIRCGRWWTNSLLGRCFIWLGQWFRRIFSVLPLIWQWLLIGGAQVFLFFMGLVILIYTGASGLGKLFLLTALLSFLGTVLYSGYAIGTLYSGVKRMGQGDLSQKVDTRYLCGSFLDFGNQLNSLADVTVEAAREQLKSERMKTELITNVSHDIKTPLTSIINYVDLLQHAPSREESQQYLEVLSRQSLRLKKLIEDLMEMSKASTGNMAVDLTDVDAVEAVNQALGEYADKLAAMPLTVVLHQPDTPVMIRADGRLLWRTLSNLLQNACKYAMPGTRLYVDILQNQHEVCICMKNISREELNISADELMERFVRGDKSRNTEGSGLGLNIAKSLMDLQQGRLELKVEGDLFRASLFFPVR